ncbi:hypothetical protein AVEN_186124-1 [Araneus ventricosus]|uniref:Uncharacterized protein n=1 Tax=Araneus ventricosus TaxID=182803 RepID=A0A4Y2HDC3_ARAVE|nr:hypothetical protein AVEN_186124-1 [Araneus ventricosus]
MSRVYCKNLMSDGVVREWCRKFKDWRTNAHDEEGQGSTSVAIKDLVQRVLEKFKWDMSDQTTYSPDLETSDFHLYLELKNWVEGQSFQKKEQLQNNVKAHLTSLAATFFEEGIENLVY